VESMSLQSMQHRVEDIPLSPTKLISDIASYKASEVIMFNGGGSLVRNAAADCLNLYIYADSSSTWLTMVTCYTEYFR